MQTDRQTDRPTDIVNYRVACTQLKRMNELYQLREGYLMISEHFLPIIAIRKFVQDGRTYIQMDATKIWNDFNGQRGTKTTLAELRFNKFVYTTYITCHLVSAHRAKALRREWRPHRQTDPPKHPFLSCSSQKMYVASFIWANLYTVLHFQFHSSKRARSHRSSSSSAS